MTSEKSNRTPDEIAEIQQRINDKTYMDERHVRLLVGALDLVSDVLAQPQREPSARDDRIQDYIKDVRRANDYCLVQDVDRAQDWLPFRTCVWALICLLEEDDYKQPPEPAPPSPDDPIVRCIERIRKMDVRIGSDDASLAINAARAAEFRSQVRNLICLIEHERHHV